MSRGTCQVYALASNHYTMVYKNTGVLGVTFLAQSSCVKTISWVEREIREIDNGLKSISHI